MRNCGGIYADVNIFPLTRFIHKWQERVFRCRWATRIHCVNASVRSSEPYNFTRVMMRTNNIFRNWPRYGEKYTDRHTDNGAQGIKLFGIVTRRPLMIFSTSFAALCAVDIINHDTNKEFVLIFFVFLFL